MSSLPGDPSRFAAEEYLALWREYGVEPLLESSALAARLPCPMTPAPAVVETPAPRAVPVLFVGEGPAAELLNKIIEAMGLTNQALYLEDGAPWDGIAPQVVVALGEKAARRLTGSTAMLASLRGKFSPLTGKPAIPVMPTYDPAFLARHPEAKREVWNDMKLVLGRLR